LNTFGRLPPQRFMEAWRFVLGQWEVRRKAHSALPQSPIGYQCENIRETLSLRHSTTTLPEGSVLAMHPPARTRFPDHAGILPPAGFRKLVPHQIGMYEFSSIEFIVVIATGPSGVEYWPNNPSGIDQVKAAAC